MVPGASRSWTRNPPRRRQSRPARRPSHCTAALRWPRRGRTRQRWPQRLRHPRWGRGRTSSASPGSRCGAARPARLRTTWCCAAARCADGTAPATCRWGPGATTQTAAPIPVARPRRRPARLVSPMRTPRQASRPLLASPPPWLSWQRRHRRWAVRLVRAVRGAQGARHLPGRAARAARAPRVRRRQRGPGRARLSPPLRLPCLSPWAPASREAPRRLRAAPRWERRGRRKRHGQRVPRPLPPARAGGGVSGCPRRRSAERERRRGGVPRQIGSGAAAGGQRGCVSRLNGWGRRRRWRRDRQRGCVPCQPLARVAPPPEARACWAGVSG